MTSSKRHTTNAKRNTSRHQTSLRTLQLLLLLSTALLLPATTNAEEWARPVERCFTSGQEIGIAFRDDEDPRSDDWVGIYPADATSPFEEPILWHYTCGRHECEGLSIGGVIVFSENDDDNRASWPLRIGEYRVVLSRDILFEGDAYEFMDVSPRFIVDQDCPQEEEGEEEEEEEEDADNREPPEATEEPATVPAASPTERPSLRPSQRPNNSDIPTQPSINDAPSGTSTNASSSRMAQVIANAKVDIAAVINERPILRALYLRMIFHDCVGGACDGCINLNNQDNGGLRSPMNSLREVEDKYVDDLSRSDIWVLATFIGVEQAMPPEGRIEMPFRHYGRVDCEERRTEGPDPPLCSGDLGTDGVLAYFEDEFGFNGQEVAAIMGAHTLGVARRNILGFDGPNGWVPNNTRFDNEYYTELVGPGDSIRGQIEGAPQWRQIQVNNTEMDPPLPNRFQWEGFPGGRRVVMLNADVALVRELTDNNKHVDTGEVSCAFVSRDPTRNGICPVAHSSVFEHMVRYRNDNMAFLVDFRSAMIKMTNVGYEEDFCDESNICKLRRIVEEADDTTMDPSTVTPTEENP